MPELETIATEEAIEEATETLTEVSVWVYDQYEVGVYNDEGSLAIHLKRHPADGDAIALPLDVWEQLVARIETIVAMWPSF
ncbi:MAG TPA: hypothetical protein VGA20_06160 [Gemmatimonadales bacterium]|jgi:hypothetical protein